jgi:hypothetical protein
LGNVLHLARNNANMMLLFEELSVPPFLNVFLTALSLLFLRIFVEVIFSLIEIRKLFQKNQ